MSNTLMVRTEMDVMTLGDVLVKSKFFSDSTQAAQAVVKVLAGNELGFGPIASMTGINIIKGRVTLSANLLASAIKRSGKYNYRIVKLDDTGCWLEFLENGEKIGDTSFTREDADRAGLNGENWKKYPRNMFFARAISNGTKFFCPDIFGGPIYTPDELGAAIDGETGEIIDGAFIATPEPLSSSKAANSGNKADTPAPSELDEYFPRHTSDEPPAEDEHDRALETPPAAQDDDFNAADTGEYHPVNDMTPFTQATNTKLQTWLMANYAPIKSFPARDRQFKASGAILAGAKETNLIAAGESWPELYLAGATVSQIFQGVAKHYAAK